MSGTGPNPRDSDKGPHTVPQPAPTTSVSATTVNNPRTEAHIDLSIKTYIDESIHLATTSITTLIIQSMKQYIDSQFDKQRLWIEQHQANIGGTWAQATQTNTNSTSTSPNNKGKETVQLTGKYPLTPVLNDLIMRTSKVTIQGQDATTPSTHQATLPMDMHRFKSTAR
ncbi:6184_t:CDS:2, partial [Gigaspora margarita]